MIKTCYHLLFSALYGLKFYIVFCFFSYTTLSEIWLFLSRFIVFFSFFNIFYKTIRICYTLFTGKFIINSVLTDIVWCDSLKLSMIIYAEEFLDMDVPYLSYVVKFVCKESINLYLFCMQINWLFFYFNQSDVSSDDS